VRENAYREEYMRRQMQTEMEMGDGNGDGMEMGDGDGMEIGEEAKKRRCGPRRKIGMGAGRRMNGGRAQDGNAD
jgi:hypothetical protein